MDTPQNLAQFIDMHMAIDHNIIVPTAAVQGVINTMYTPHAQNTIPLSNAQGSIYITQQEVNNLVSGLHPPPNSNAGQTAAFYNTQLMQQGIHIPIGNLQQAATWNINNPPPPPPSFESSGGERR